MFAILLMSSSSYWCLHADDASLVMADSLSLPQKAFFDARTGLLGELNCLANVNVSNDMSTLCTGLLRWHSIKSLWQADAKGNLKGDGLQLGGSMVIGPGDQGILFQHQSREFGDRADPKDILAAVQKIEN